jgi:uncharacterized protein YuzE
MGGDGHGSAQRSQKETMKMLIAGVEFDQVHYDDRGDVLYLSVGQPREPASAFETSEGHNIEYDSQGRVIGLVLYGVRHTLDRKGEVSLTWPPSHLAADSLEPALAVA